MTSDSGHVANRVVFSVHSPLTAEPGAARLAILGRRLMLSGQIFVFRLALLVDGRGGQGLEEISDEAHLNFSAVLVGVIIYGFSLSIVPSHKNDKPRIHQSLH
jgi:hypothetical protein